MYKIINLIKTDFGRITLTEFSGYDSAINWINKMDIRSQISMVFHLDKCIGCHTCSIDL